MSVDNEKLKATIKKLIERGDVYKTVNFWPTYIIYNKGTNEVDIEVYRSLTNTLVDVTYYVKKGSVWRKHSIKETLVYKGLDLYRSVKARYAQRQEKIANDRIELEQTLLKDIDEKKN